MYKRQKRGEKLNQLSGFEEKKKAAFISYQAERTCVT